MTAQQRTPDDRDRHLRVVRRLRHGVVTAGVVGSLGVAGTVAASTGAGGSTDPVPTPTRTPSSRPAQVTSYDDPASRGDDRRPVRHHPQSKSSAPSLGHGTGPSHAGSSGS